MPARFAKEEDLPRVNELRKQVNDLHVAGRPDIFKPGFSEELLRFGAQGKPFLAGGVPFSVSHGGDLIVLAVCEDADGVGVDTEPVREMGYYRDILPVAFSGREQRYIGSDAGKAVRIWTRKECLYKCVGEGIDDISGLPEVIGDEVLFLGHLCRLVSIETDGHIISAACYGADTALPREIKISDVRIDL